MSIRKARLQIVAFMQSQSEWICDQCIARALASKTGVVGRITRQLASARRYFDRAPERLRVDELATYLDQLRENCALRRGFQPKSRKLQGSSKRGGVNECKSPDCDIYGRRIATPRGVSSNGDFS